MLPLSSASVYSICVAQQQQNDGWPDNRYKTLKLEQKGYERAITVEDYQRSQHRPTDEYIHSMSFGLQKGPSGD